MNPDFVLQRGRARVSAESERLDGDSAASDAASTGPRSCERGELWPEVDHVYLTSGFNGAALV